MNFKFYAALSFAAFFFLISVAESILIYNYHNLCRELLEALKRCQSDQEARDENVQKEGA